jgi:radical SAM superfamily enzyme with C-terminal helix-hairpin-helix motif
MAAYARGNDGELTGVFDAVHSHTVTRDNLLHGSTHAASYAELRVQRGSYERLVSQLGWESIAEIELYRGCTRRKFCSFCNEPDKAPLVAFRSVEDVQEEINALYAAGVRNFRLGQQTCFFSYHNRDVAAIGSMLAGIRSSCPELQVLHIDNADPLAVASKSGARIAKLVAEYCTDGNCAPMGMESFDRNVIQRNNLTCTPDILMRAIENINEAGAELGPHGLPKLLPGLNLIYGLPGETHRTHFENLSGLSRILDSGALCHRTNVRQVRAYPGTPLAMETEYEAPSAAHFPTWKEDLTQIYEVPMKARVYPIGRQITGLHSFFVTSSGTWHRRLGSYSIQVVERESVRPLFQPTDLVVSGHSGRYIYGMAAC